MATGTDVSSGQCMVAVVLGRKVIRSVWHDWRAWRCCVGRVCRGRGADAVWACAFRASGLSLLCGVLAGRPRVLSARILHHKGTSTAAALTRRLCLGGIDEQKVLLVRHDGLGPPAPSLSLGPVKTGSRDRTSDAPLWRAQSRAESERRGSAGRKWEKGARSDQARLS